MANFDDQKLTTKLADNILQIVGSSSNAESDIREFVTSKLGNKRADNIESEFKKRFILGKLGRNKKKVKDPDQNKSFVRTLSRSFTDDKMLPRNCFKYADLEKSNLLWMSYMKDYLQLDFLERNGFSGDPCDKHFELISTKLIKADYHGAYVTVISSVSSFVGLEGIVVTETQNAFTIITKKSILKTIPKKQCQFRFEVGKYILTVYGKDISMKPSARITKRNKTPMFNVL